MPKLESHRSALLRGLSIIQTIAQSSRPLSVTDLVEILQLPKPTIHRITLQLESAGFLQRSPINKRFFIGYQLKSLSMDILSNISVSAPRHAILQTLSNEVRETCNCTMLDGNHTIYFDRVESNWPIQIQLTPGSKLPLHATASGKLFLANMSPQDRKNILNLIKLDKKTEQTITDIKQLEIQLLQIKKEQIGFDNEEFITGMIAIAVPVFDQNKKISFTVAAHAPTTRKSLQDLYQYIPNLRKASEALSKAYHGEIIC